MFYYVCISIVISGFFLSLVRCCCCQNEMIILKCWITHVVDHLKSDCDGQNVENNSIQNSILLCDYYNIWIIPLGTSPKFQSNWSIKLIKRFCSLRNELDVGRTNEWMNEWRNERINRTKASKAWYLQTEWHSGFCCVMCAHITAFNWFFHRCFRDTIKSTYFMSRYTTNSQRMARNSIRFRFIL